MWGLTTAMVGPSYTSLAVLQTMHVLKEPDAGAMLPAFTAIWIVVWDDSNLPTSFEL